MFIIFLLVVFFLTWKYNIKLVSIFLFVLFSIPNSWALIEKIHVYINLTRSIKINFAEMLFLVLSVWAAYRIFIKKEFPRYKMFSISNLIWLTTLFVFAIVGFAKWKHHFVFDDLRLEMFWILPLILITFVQKPHIEGLIKTLISSSIIFSVFDIFIFLFKNSLFKDVYGSTSWVGANRIGFANSYLILLIIVILFNKMHLVFQKKWSYLLQASFVLLLVTVLLGRSVSMIFCTVFVLLTCIIINLVKNKKYKTLSILSLIFLVMIISFFSFYNPNNDSNNLLLKTMNKVYFAVTNPYTLPSWRSRMITNNFAMHLFSKHPMGTGLGTTFVTFIQNGALAQKNALYVDNAAVTILVKLGIIGFLIFCINILIIGFIIIINILRSNKTLKTFQWSLLSVYLSLLSTMISTAHVFNNIDLLAVLSITFLMSSLMIREVGRFSD